MELRHYQGAARKMKETEKFLKWYEAEKRKGLVHIGFSLAGNRGSPSLEEVFAELNECNRLLAEGSFEEFEEGT